MLSRSILTCLVCIAAQSLFYTARAQYLPELHPTERRAVEAGQSLLVDWSAPVMNDIGAQFGCELWYIFRADATAHRMFAVYEGDDPEKCYNTDFTEYEVVSAVSGQAAADYTIDGGQMYIGVGRCSQGKVGDALSNQVSAQQVEWDVLCTFVRGEDGARLLDLVGAQRKFITDLYALDLTNDGLLDLACASSWGFSGGGGLDFVTVMPDGSFRQLWESASASRWLDYPPLIESTLPCASTAASVHDFDGNGSWEIETQQYLDYGGGMGSYTYNVLHTFDPVSGGCLPCTDEYPELFEEQRRFYEAFAQALAACEESPEPFKRQIGEYEQLVWEYGGMQYRISGFRITADDVRRLLQSWDEYAEKD